MATRRRENRASLRVLRMRWVLLAFLTLLAAFASVAVALRTKPAGRTELALTSCIVWNAIIGAPIYALGLTHHLSATPLALLSAAFSTSVLVGASWRGSIGRSVREVASGVVLIVTLPFEGLAIATRARSVVTLALALVAFLIVYVGIASYFTPSWRQWDALWYHEPIIGFTIQNHGFSPVDLPPDLQKANGYPRFCEMFQLWFVIFTGRRLLELANSLIAPGLMYATFVIARRYTKDVLSCMGWTAVVMLMPTASYLLDSIYIDIHVAFFVLAATHYATRPVFRLVDAWLAALCITLAIGSKVLALPPAAVVTVIALVRLIRHHGFRLRSLGTQVGGGALILGMAAAVYWRNWIHYKNPFWPDLAYDNDKYKIHLPHVSFAPNALDMNMPWRDLLEDLFSIPYSVSGLGPKGQLYDYGFAVAWVVFPLGALALVGVLLSSGRDLFGRLFRVPAWKSPDALNALLVSLPMIVQVYTSPALWSARYHIANVAALTCLIAFWSGRARWRVFGEGAVAAACVMSLVVFYWVKPRWWWMPSELAKLAAIPYPAREATPTAMVSKTLWRDSGSPVTREVGLERAKLKPGEIVLFNDGIQWPALLWNDDYSNKLIYVERGVDYFAKAKELGARWVYCRHGDADCNAFKQPSSGWEDIGSLNVEDWGRVYRRVAP